MRCSLTELSEEMKLIGRLSSLITSYIRHCCRAQYDGTDEYTLKEFRRIAINMLEKYADDYQFADYHLKLFSLLETEEMLSLVDNTRSKKRPCLSCTNTGDLPKKICLHCPEVGKIMKKLREMNE